MKSVKPSIDILKGHSTGVNMDVSAPHLIHKWLKKSRQSPSFMLEELGKRNINRYFFFAPHALACRRNVWRDLKIFSAPPHCRASGALEILRELYEAFTNCATF
jgi:hypothetical protein